MTTLVRIPTSVSLVSPYPVLAQQPNGKDVHTEGFEPSHVHPHAAMPTLAPQRAMSRFVVITPPYRPSKISFPHFHPPKKQKLIPPQLKSQRGLRITMSLSCRVGSDCTAKRTKLYAYLAVVVEWEPEGKPTRNSCTRVVIWRAIQPTPGPTGPRCECGGRLAGMEEGCFGCVYMQ